MTKSNVFDVLTMNDPLPEIVLQHCFDAIDCITDIDPDEVDVKWTSPRMSCEFIHDDVKFEVYYNTADKRTEVKISVSDEIYQKHLASLRKYPQYQNKTDRECWPQYHIVSKDLDDCSMLSIAYEDIQDNLCEV